MNIRLTEDQKIQIKDPIDIYKIMQQILLRENSVDQDREHFWGIGLNSANKILYIELISLGSINNTIVEPMEVFSVALQKRTVKMILVHNHPSGDIVPSDEDKDVTDRLIQVGRIVNIEVIEHLIICTSSFYSFEANGLLEELGLSTKFVPNYLLEEKIRKEEKAIREKVILITEKKALQKGEKNKAVAMAKKMKKAGKPIEEIIEFTELSKEAIEKL